MKKVFLILGTRPEVIKFAPLYYALKASGKFSPFIIASGQHRELAMQAFASFGLSPYKNLGLMRDNQTPNGLLGTLLTSLEPLLISEKPDCVLVQGDTTSALGGALSAFHLKIPVGHVEAGLRTYDFYSPFPEEMNRSAISKLASFHFCPTDIAAKNLRQEGLTERVFMVGNTVVDAVLDMSNRLASGQAQVEPGILKLSNAAKRLVLVTGHRRENFDKPLKVLCQTIEALVREEREVEVIFPVHLNPNIYGPVHEILQGKERIHLVEPVDYPTLIHLIQESDLIISDSGGIQEEAPSFHTPVIVTRKTTERPEGLTAGTSFLGALEDSDGLLSLARKLLSTHVKQLATVANPYGDGTASKKITEILGSFL